MNTTFSLARHHLVLDPTVTSSAAALFQRPRGFRRLSVDSQRPTRTRKRWNSGEKRSAPLGRSGSQTQIDSSDCDSNSASNWSEYTVRRSIVKFRTRRGAKRWSGRRRKARTPSNTIQRVLDNVYDITRCQEATFGEKLVAVLYSWFYGSIIGLYFSLTDDGREKSFPKWLLASCLITASALMLLGLAAVGLYFFNAFLLKLLDAGLVFGTVMVSLGIVFLGLLAVVNYN